MTVLTPFVWAFLIGGLLCVAAQLTVDATPLTPAHTMVLFVTLGAIASAAGLYEPLVKLGGAGATVPLTGFGHALVQGALESAQRDGPSGLITGGLEATALGITIAILAGLTMTLIFNPKG